MREGAAGTFQNGNVSPCLLGFFLFFFIFFSPRKHYSEQRVGRVRLSAGRSRHGVLGVLGSVGLAGSGAAPDHRD